MLETCTWPRLHIAEAGFRLARLHAECHEQTVFRRLVSGFDGVEKGARIVDVMIGRHDEQNSVRTGLLNRQLRSDGSGGRGGAACRLEHDALMGELSHS